MALAKLPNSIDPIKMTSSISSSSVMGTRRLKFKLEPLKILEPSNKKLNLPESQRIMFIIERLIKKIEIVDYISLIINNEDKIRELIRISFNDEDRNSNIEEKLISMFQNHKRLVDTYNRGQFKTDDSVSSQKKESLEHLIKSSCKDIIRVMNNRPSFFENIKIEFGKINNPQLVEFKSNLLIKYIQIFCKYILKI